MFLFFFIICVVGIHAQPNESENNEAIARRFVEFWTLEHYKDLAQLFAENCIYVETPSGNKFSGREAIQNYASTTLNGMSDTQAEIITVVANDKMAVVEWIWSGTNSIGWPNIPASGKTFRLPVLTIMEIENGMIIRNRDYWDWETFYNAVKSDDQSE